jgi:hypothetical protein
MGGLRNSQTYFSSSHFRNLESHSLTSLTSKGCQWPRKKVTKKNLNERELCMNKLLLYGLKAKNASNSVFKKNSYDPNVSVCKCSWQPFHLARHMLPVSVRCAVCRSTCTFEPLIEVDWRWWAVTQVLRCHSTLKHLVKIRGCRFVFWKLLVSTIARSMLVGEVGGSLPVRDLKPLQSVYNL